MLIKRTHFYPPQSADISRNRWLTVVDLTTHSQNMYPLSLCTKRDIESPGLNIKNLIKEDANNSTQKI